MQPLNGIRVLDLSRLLPGPYATMILTDLGAEVIKIEDPGAGDYARWAPPQAGRFGALFASLNRGKQSVAINLKTPGGVDAFQRLAATADVVVDSFRPGVLDRLGVGYGTLRAANEGLIQCSITGYGQNGPYRTRAGHDLNYIGLAGLLGISGQDPARPAFPGGQVADVGGGSLLAVVGILSALMERQQTGKGQFVDTSMTHGALAFITMHLAMHRTDPGMSTPGPGQMQLNGAHCCYTVYPTKDQRWVTLGALEPKFWENWCTATGREDLRGQGFAPARDGEEVYEAVKAEFLARDRNEWEALNAEHDFCCEPILHFDEVAEHPQLKDMFFTLDDNGTPLQQVEAPLGLDHVSGRQATPPPGLGEHTRAVLAAAGLDDAAIDELKQAGAIGG